MKLNTFSHPIRTINYLILALLTLIAFDLFFGIGRFFPKLERNPSVEEIGSNSKNAQVYFHEKMNESRIQVLDYDQIRIQEEALENLNAKFRKNIELLEKNITSLSLETVGLEQSAETHFHEIKESEKSLKLGQTDTEKTRELQKQLDIIEDKAEQNIIEMKRLRSELHNSVEKLKELEEIAVQSKPYTPSDQELERLNALKEKFIEVPMGFETSDVALLKIPFEATLKINAIVTKDTNPDRVYDVRETELRGSLSDQNTKIETVNITPNIMAKLSGPNFDIHSETPEIQQISPVVLTEWRWKVTPHYEGIHQLTLNIYAIDKETATALRTYEKTIEVKVIPKSFFSHIVAISSEFKALLYALFGGAGVVIFGVMRDWFKTRKGQSKDK